jgi:hypothetical protein
MMRQSPRPVRSIAVVIAASLCITAGLLAYLGPYVRARYAGFRADLAGAALPRAFLRGADLRRADLKTANLKGADLRGAWLVQANLEGAVLTGADLSGADLAGANLKAAKLTGARYSTWTRWPRGFDPPAHGCVKSPLPQVSPGTTLLPRPQDEGFDLRILRMASGHFRTWRDSAQRQVQGLFR